MFRGRSKRANQGVGARSCCKKVVGRMKKGAGKGTAEQQQKNEETEEG
jgi:hypothetical protein